MHTNLDIKEHLFSSNEGVEDFSVASHQRKKADLMTVECAEADLGGSEELLSCERGTTSGVAILNKSGKTFSKC
jgi:hypothetical protein